LFRGWLREPLVHFVLIGAALFLVYRWTGSGSGPDSRRIVVTRGRIESLAATFTRTWQRPPSEQEVKNLIDEYVRDEIATREAMAEGLDRDDTVIRRRLRQKLEFITEDAASTAAPTDADLARWLREHPGTYRREAQVSFRQVFVDRARGERARFLLARLSKQGAEAAAEGDASLLPAEMGPSSEKEVTEVFGGDFAREVFRLEPGRWAGPVESTYGLHLVFVRSQSTGEQPRLADVRTAVERDFTDDRRKRSLEALYSSLLSRYTVEIESTTRGKAR
jgi:hypothetical protein